MKRISFLLAFSLLILLTCRAQEEITLSTMTGSIYGTLQVPDVHSPVPVVLIIAGSGPTDRNGNNTQMQNNSLKMLADSLMSHGIASLRYDKRGIAASKEAGPAEGDLLFDTYVDDAAAWIRKLRKDPRFSAVIVAGHSEGSLIGMIAAGSEKVKGMISIAGAGKSADQILKDQLAGQPVAFKDASYRAIDSLKAGKLVSSVSPDLYMLFRPSIQPYMISWFRYDPQQIIAGLTMPVLIVQGVNDIQIGKEDAELLAKANPSAQLVLIQGMNHILKDSGPMRQENLATYSNPTLPLNAELVKNIIRFIGQL